MAHRRLLGTPHMSAGIPSSFEGAAPIMIPV
jgi:hypothetical protein